MSTLECNSNMNQTQTNRISRLCEYLGVQFRLAWTKLKTQQCRSLTNATCCLLTTCASGHYTCTNQIRSGCKALSTHRDSQSQWWEVAVYSSQPSFVPQLHLIGPKLTQTTAGAQEHTKQHSLADTHDRVYITKNRPFSLC